MSNGSSGCGNIGIKKIKERGWKRVKIKKLARLCSARKRIQLYDGDKVQYIGDGSAIYPVWGMPDLDEESLMVVFDVPEKKQKDFLVSRDPTPRGINLGDVDETEQMVERLDLEIDGMMLLRTSRGLAMVQGKYLSPIEDEENIELYERTGANGAQYIAAKAGFNLMALISVVQVTAGFVDKLAELLELAAQRAAQNLREESAQKDEAQ